MELFNESRNRWFTPLFILGLVTFITACRSPESHAVSTGKIGVRNNAASLLHDLMGDERNVSKLLIIKRDRRELHEVIKKVSSTADAVRKRLEELAVKDSTLDLRSTALPSGEKAVRESESKTRGSELLHAAGSEFEFKLLLTQAEALDYATHLAKVAAENETSPESAKVFTDLSAELKARHQDVIKLLQAPPR